MADSAKSTLEFLGEGLPVNDCAPDARVLRNIGAHQRSAVLGDIEGIERNLCVEFMRETGLVLLEDRFLKVPVPSDA